MQRGKTRGRSKEERENDLRCGAVQGDGSTKDGCRESGVALSSVWRVESSSSSGSQGETSARKTYSSENAPTVTIDVTRDDAEQQAAIAGLQRKVEYHEKKPVLLSTPVFSVESRDDKKDRAGSCDTGRKGCSREPERKYNGKE